VGYVSGSHLLYDGSVIVDVKDVHGDVDAVEDARRVFDEDADVE